ncbi:hypothetical protein HHK36_030549 [Tetracentron sinense]|uniref:Uncharacterized protein n=1 Tax=Tetracentron sinense TaxID=13715 RepID=A0A834YCC4_TETSI|nr:hypothetical protein HHK36_030549 [Tetracentron sinense]
MWTMQHFLMERQLAWEWWLEIGKAKFSLEGVNLFPGRLARNSLEGLVFNFIPPYVNVEAHEAACEALFQSIGLMYSPSGTPIVAVFVMSLSRIIFDTMDDSSSNKDIFSSTQHTPAQRVTSILLNGRNFASWSRSFRLYVGGKGKTGWLLGTEKKPATTDPKYAQWDMENYYFGYLQSRWEELAQYEPLSDFTPTDASLLVKRLDRQHTYQFLMGLRHEFEPLKTQILNTSPMPSLFEAFATVDGEERRQRLLQPSSLSEPTIDNMAFAANSGSRTTGGKILYHHCATTVDDGLPDFSQLQSQIGHLQKQLGSLTARVGATATTPTATSATGTPTAFHDSLPFVLEEETSPLACPVPIFDVPSEPRSSPPPLQVYSRRCHAQPPLPDSSSEPGPGRRKNYNFMSSTQSVDNTGMWNFEAGTMEEALPGTTTLHQRSLLHAGVFLRILSDGMADPLIYGNPERDIEQALVALKKGTQLIKYSRKGKPKLCPFRISIDETTLIWYSQGKDRNLKLSSVARIIPGQRTAVFRRFLRPEKDYLSFSLLYNNGERSLDLICKDKVEAEVWFAGLKALISTGQQRSRRTRSDISDLHDGGDFIQNGRPSGATLEITSSISRNHNTKSLVDFFSREPSLNLTSSDVGSDRANMQLRTSIGDGFRISVSSAPSCSSQSSGPDDIESLGDVYVWGQVWCDGILADGSVNSFPSKTDVLLPKPLESNVVLDVHQIACGVRHTVLVTRQGEVFTWGEESGGRLGHGIDKDFSRPHLVEFLAVNNVDYVACGEYHTCAISMAGDLFTWGDGTYNAGLLGHGTDVSHWIPKRVSGPLEGLQVLSVACGTWHTALATSNGKLFTFGDGTFGVLGHGDRESVAYPREVHSLSGLKTIKVACGVWHTAAIVEVMGQGGANVSSRKLFTWGDGDKNRLGHGSKQTHLLPTCISSLIDYNFHQLACGHNITVALTTSGHVFTMGGTAYGQLGNPQSDGKTPCLVQDRLVGEFVEEISCGAFHVAVLTSRSEVFTWGRGANGRLGHGDTEDRKSPTLVEALKDRHVNSISCGSNFTASICIHKWVSSADQSLCSGCRQTFGFTRKRHNCYNCGLVHCHACSSKKALRAALAPTPGKPHRVCDSCYAKLKASEAGNASTFNRKITTPRRSIDNRERLDKGEVRSSRVLLSPIIEPIKYLEVKSSKNETKSDSLSTIRASQVPSLLQLKDIVFPSSLSALQYALKPVTIIVPQPTLTSRSASPYSRKPSPPRSGTPVFSRGVIDSLKKTNELLNQEVLKLQSQVKSLRQKCEVQDVELQKSHKTAQEAASLAAEESSKYTVATEVVKSISVQLKDITEKLPPEVYDSETFKAMHTQVEALLKTNETYASEVSSSFPADSTESVQQNTPDKTILVNESSTNIEYQRMDDPGDAAGVTNLSQNAVRSQSIENVSSSPKVSAMKSDGETEVIEQFEPGVYVTLIRLRSGTKVFKRVRFSFFFSSDILISLIASTSDAICSKRRFAEQQAEEWWKQNKDRLLKKYSQPVTNSAPTGSTGSAAPAEKNEGALSLHT